MNQFTKTNLPIPNQSNLVFEPVHSFRMKWFTKMNNPNKSNLVFGAKLPKPIKLKWIIFPYVFVVFISVYWRKYLITGKVTILLKKLLWIFMKKFTEKNYLNKVIHNNKSSKRTNALEWVNLLSCYTATIVVIANYGKNYSTVFWKQLLALEHVVKQAESPCSLAYFLPNIEKDFKLNFWLHGKLV